MCSMLAASPRAAIWCVCLGMSPYNTWALGLRNPCIRSSKANLFLNIIVFMVVPAACPYLWSGYVVFTGYLTDKNLSDTAGDCCNLHRHDSLGTYDYFSKVRSLLSYSLWIIYRIEAHQYTQDSHSHRKESTNIP